MPMRLAVIGMGYWGKKLIRVFDQVGNVTLCCNRSTRDDHAWLENTYPHIRSSFDVSDALRNDEIDAVVIATPMDSHYELAAEAFRAGKHVFLEKPPATSTLEADNLVRLAARSAKVLFVGHTFLFHPAYEQIFRTTEEDPIVHATAVWWRNDAGGGNTTLELGPHEIAIALSLLRERADAVQVDVEDHGRRSTDDYVRVTLNVPHRQTKWHLEIDRSRPRKSKTICMTTANGRRLVWEDERLFQTVDQRDFRELDLPPTEPLLGEALAFVAAVAGRPHPSNSPILARDVVQVLEHIDQGPERTDAGADGR